MFKGHAQNHSSLIKCIGQDSVNQCSVKKLLNINFNVSNQSMTIFADYGYGSLIKHESLILTS